MTITLTARATDAGGLVATKTLAVSVAAAQPPVSIFTSQTPAQVNQTDGSQLELGVKFQSSVAGKITGIRFWKGSSEAAGHIGRIWSASGTLLASVTFTNETASGWQTQNLATPLNIDANAIYVVSVGTTNNFYVVSGNALVAAVASDPLSTIVGGNGVFANRGAFPNTGSFKSGNYFRDVVFVPASSGQPNNPPDDPPPALTRWPDATDTGVQPGITLTPYTGPMTISTPGTVVENKIINGRIDVTASNVTIQNNRITYNDYFAIDVLGTNCRVEYNDIIGPGNNGDSPGAIMIEASGAVIFRNDVSGAEHGIVLGPGSAQILENYVHDGGSNKEDPHIGGISLKGGQSGVLIQGNTVIGRDTADIFLQNNFGPITNVTINKNYLTGVPNYNIYVEGRLTGGPTTGVTITNNVMVKGQYDYYSVVDASPSFAGNVQLLPGQTVPPP